MSDADQPLRIAIIAGETSGDQLGGWLMEAIRRSPLTTRHPPHFIGIGGERMQAQGLQSLFPMREISLMGFAEILPHIFRLLRRIKETVAFIEREKPDVLLTVDSPGFVFRVVRELRERGIARPRFIHYVAPTVWAYKPERAKKTAALFDRLLVLLPFEPPYFEKEGLKTDFIGHEVAWQWKQKGDGAAFRARYGITPEAKLLAVFPGSRQGELKRHLPIFRDTVARLVRTMPGLEAALQLPVHLLPAARAATRDWPLKVHLLASNAEKKDLFAAADAALAKSGTIALECALAGLPAIVTYRANPLTVWMLRRMITIPFASLANLLLGREVQPELLQEKCTPERLSAALLPLLTDAQAQSAQRAALGEMASLLGTADTRSPSNKAAEIILSEIVIPAQAGI